MNTLGRTRRREVEPGLALVALGALGLVLLPVAAAAQEVEAEADAGWQGEVAGEAPAQAPPAAEESTAEAPGSDAPADAVAVEEPAPGPADTELAAPPATEGDPTAEVVPEAPEDTTEPGAEEPTPSLKVGMGIRAGTALVFDDPAADGTTLRLHDGVANQLNVRPYFSGQLTEAVGFTGNLEITDGSVDILDAIIQVKVADEFQIWLGQHIPAMERNNFNGPFYNNGWNLPISVQTLPFDIAGRDRGVTAWGLVADGLFKYHVSVVDLHPPASSNVNGVDTAPATIGNARIAARATINLLDPENYYYTSGTYYGEQDTLAIGAVIQSQKGVDTAPGTDPAVELDNDLLAFSADLLFEKNLGEGGTFTLEGGYWNYEGTGADYAPNQGTTDFGSGAVGPINGSSYLVGISWLTPEKVGYGKIQPLAKIQIGDYEPNRVVVADFGLGYIVDNFNHRWFLNYRYQDNGGDTEAVNMLQVGAQLQL